MQRFYVHVIQGDQPPLTAEEREYLEAITEDVDGLIFDPDSDTFEGDDAEPEELVVLMRIFIQRFRPTMRWALQATWYADCGRVFYPDNFGGHAWVITKDTEEYINTRYWVDAKMKRGAPETLSGFIRRKWSEYYQALRTPRPKPEK